MKRSLSRLADLKSVEAVRRSLTAQAEKALMDAEGKTRSARENINEAAEEVSMAERDWVSHLSADNVDPEHMQRLALLLLSKKTALDAAQLVLERFEIAERRAQRDVSMCKAEERVSERVRQNYATDLQKSQAAKQQNRGEDEFSRRWWAS
ncbi:MAG: hypothetical protein AAGA08_16725 [Pseudomonadota bacterium]